jgi:hypothetical protein
MPKIKNVSPFGDLDVPLLGRVIEAGETVDVSDEEAEELLKQPLNYQPVGQAAKKIEKEVTNDDNPA